MLYSLLLLLAYRCMTEFFRVSTEPKQYLWNKWALNLSADYIFT
ncbi:hypothetical protein T08_865 [Trichinella sp. T8]|nr:hypothetical protein T08_865 [Trichinella sp. T8]